MAQIIPLPFLDLKGKWISAKQPLEYLGDGILDICTSMPSLLTTMKIFKLPEVLFSAILISPKLYSFSLKYQQQNLWKDFSSESSVIILLFQFSYKKICDKESWLFLCIYLNSGTWLYKPKENSEVINSNVLVKAVTEYWDLKIETDHKRSHLQMTSLNDFFCKWFLQMTVASIECLGAEMGRMLVHVLFFAFLFFPNVQVAKSLVCIRGTGNFQSEVNWKVCRWQCKC